MRHFELITRLLAALILLAVAAALCAVWIFGAALPERIIAFRDGAGTGWRIAAAVGAIAVAALAVVRLLIPAIENRRRQHFATHRFGDDAVSVSIGTVEQLAARCVREHQELYRPRVKVRSAEDGVSVEIVCSLRSGTDLPVSADYLQRQIRRHIADATGLKVTSVRVRVENLVGEAPKIADVPTHEHPPRPAAKPEQNENQSTGGNQA